MSDETDRVTRTDAEAAVRTLLRWAGDDPAREGLVDTPLRVARAWREWFSGYSLDPDAYLARTFEEVETRAGWRRRGLGQTAVYTEPMTCAEPAECMARIGQNSRVRVADEQTQPRRIAIGRNPTR